MKQPKTFLLLSVVVAVLVLGIAYAAISSVTLNVNGNVTASPSDANFKVAFTKQTSTSGAGTIQASAEGLNGTLTVTGLTTVGQEATAIYNIENTSDDIVAKLTVNPSWANKEYFDVTATLGTDTLPAVNGATTLTVVVRLKKSPITADVTTTVNVAVTANPVHAS